MIRRLLFAISLIGMCLLAAPQTAGAFSFFSGVDCSKAQDATVCQDQAQKTNPDDPLTSPDGLLIKIANIIATIAGAAAVIVLIVGALRLITSGSDTSKGGRVDADVENARRSIAGALIGIVIIVLAKVIITYVVNRIK